MNGEPAYIKGEIVPLFRQFNLENLEDFLAEIHDKTDTKWFSLKGRRYLHQLNFDDHQTGLRKDRRGKDKLPNYSTSGLKPDHSGTSPGLVRHEVEVEGELGVEGEKNKRTAGSEKNPPGGSEKKDSEQPAFKENKDEKEKNELLIRDLGHKLVGWKYKDEGRMETFNPAKFVKYYKKLKSPGEVLIIMLESLILAQGKFGAEINPWAYAKTIYNTERGNYFARRSTAESEEFKKVGKDPGDITALTKGIG
jgi:hypothetical protein